MSQVLTYDTVVGRELGLQDRITALRNLRPGTRLSWPEGDLSREVLRELLSLPESIDVLRWLEAERGAAVALLAIEQSLDMAGMMYGAQNRIVSGMLTSEQERQVHQSLQDKYGAMYGPLDYVVKPFSPTELAARIRAALRKRAASEPSEPYVLGDLTIDYAERRVTLAGRPLPLIAMEYRLLAELSANAGRLLTYEHLLERVWGEKSSGDVRPMRTIVSKLRRKLGDDADNPTYIFTEPRVGYRMPKGEGQEGSESQEVS